MLLTLLTVAQPARAQTPAADPATRATVTLDAGVSRIAGEWVTHGGGSLTFRISSLVEIGGGRRIDLSHPALTGLGSPSRLHFGYAGLQVTLRPGRPEDCPVCAWGHSWVLATSM